MSGVTTSSLSLAWSLRNCRCRFMLIKVRKDLTAARTKKRFLVAPMKVSWQQRLTFPFPFVHHQSHVNKKLLTVETRTLVRREKRKRKEIREGKVLRVFSSGRWLPRNQGWLNFWETKLVTVRKSLHRSSGRNLPVKEFCYLRTVNLTAAMWLFLC